ncbi:MAG: hypothetical protein M3315_15420, partial [Actinomycetota bacterium]|nr:hypothetical protein [Actinomycetota bacterium]
SVAEEEATESIFSTAKDGGVSEDDPKGLADADESAGEIAPEEDPTTSYRGALDRDRSQPEQVSGEESGAPETGQERSEQAQGTPGGDDTRPGEVVWDEGTEEPETGALTGGEATENSEI